MRIPDLEHMISEHTTKMLLCKNCGRQKEFHIKIYDHPWSYELECVVHYQGKPYNYESS